VTTVTDAVSAVTDSRSRRKASLASRLAGWVVRIRSAAGEDLQTTIARAIDEAFAGIAREFRR